ncbi:MAG TPA: cupin domain-containing protein, partial [Rhizobiales bacterium]|nr:cupin domain-containing protein [Hyphomicrobiales bacterium]
MSKTEKPAVVDTAQVKARIGTGYPEQFADKSSLREKKVLGDLFGLDQFGVNLTKLPPGQWSALRHWHEKEDEFIYVVSGELVLVDDEGEHRLRAGMCAGFPAGVRNGHHVVNNSDEPASFIEIGTRSVIEHAEYPDADLIADKDENGFSFSNR